VDTIEVLAHPAKALKAGIFMIPALIIGDKRWFNPPSLEELLSALDES
jgi:2-hydroxychromene-2-carboxylate isomerase